MKPTALPFLRLCPILLLAACTIADGEDKPALTLSPELAIDAPEVPDEKNGILLFEQRLEKLDQASIESLNKAIEQLRAGTPVNDPALFKTLEERHRIARDTLKAPARSQRGTEFSIAPITIIYIQACKGADALASRASLAGDRAAAHAYRRDLLEWSRVIRGSHPELVGYMIGLIGWREAFNGMLRDWERHSDQKAGLAEIEGLLREFPCPSTELIPVYRREGQFWCDSGGTRGILEKLPPGQPAALLLREPFDRLTIGEILRLPYDEAAEARRVETQCLGCVAAIRRGAPLVEWPGFLRGEPGGKNLDDYRKLPNGMGDFLEDYSPGYHQGGLSNILFHQPAMETCIAWLKTEGEGNDFIGDSPGVKPDPVTGEPLKIEPEHRRIRSVGADLKFEMMGEIKRLPGITVSDDDLLLQVPSWRKGGD